MKGKYEQPEMDILIIKEVLTMVSGDPNFESSTDWENWGSIN